jgi:hypothetical protein
MAWPRRHNINLQRCGNLISHRSCESVADWQLNMSKFEIHVLTDAESIRDYTAPNSMRTGEYHKQIPWPECASELRVYRPIDRRLSANLVSIFADRRVSRFPYGRNIFFLDRGRYQFFQVAPHVSARNRTRSSGQELLPLDQRGGRWIARCKKTGRIKLAAFWKYGAKSQNKPVRAAAFPAKIWIWIWIVEMASDDISVKFHEDWFGHEGNIKVITSTVTDSSK